MLSVLIPCYNYNVSNLLKALDFQLKKQSFQYEIILNDDCSSDLETEKINKYTVENIGGKYIKNKENLGRTATRQNLAKSALYDKLLFMDADVMPVNDDFINKFDLSNLKADLVFGGITYAKKKPEKNKILRWTYGKSREAKPLTERQKHPYLSIISQCFLIKKSIFLSTNSFLENKYGVDIVFCFNLEKAGAKVKHIDNPIVHLGLENNTSFIKKSEKGLEALIEFEQKKLIPNNFKNLQISYLKLSKSNLIKLFILKMDLFKRLILFNLKSSKPSLLLFDLYRLYYFTKLHK